MESLGGDELAARGFGLWARKAQARGACELAVGRALALMACGLPDDARDEPGGALASKWEAARRLMESSGAGFAPGPPDPWKDIPYPDRRSARSRVLANLAPPTQGRYGWMRGVAFGGFMASEVFDHPLAAARWIIERGERSRSSEAPDHLITPEGSVIKELGGAPLLWARAVVAGVESALLDASSAPMADGPRQGPRL